MPLKTVPVVQNSQTGTRAKPQQASNAQRVQTFEASTLHEERTEAGFLEVLGGGFSSRLLRPGGRSAALLEHVALSEAFLQDYYAQVERWPGPKPRGRHRLTPGLYPLMQAAAWAAPPEDGRLHFTFEGQGSSAGSLSCCSSLPETQDHLSFLHDLGDKFKTLAEVCSPAEDPPPPPPLPSPPPTLMHRSAGAASPSDHTVRPRPEALLLPSPPWAELLGPEAITEGRWSKLGRDLQTVLVPQQPVCCAGTVLQPVQYVVQPQLTNVVLLADPAAGTSYPGLFVVQGSESPPPPAPISLPASPGGAFGIAVHASKRVKNLQGHAGATGPVVALPVGHTGTAAASVSVQGWKVVVPDQEGRPAPGPLSSLQRRPLLGGAATPAAWGGGSLLQPQEERSWTPERMISLDGPSSLRAEGQKTRSWTGSGKGLESLVGPFAKPGKE